MSDKVGKVLLVIASTSVIVLIIISSIKLLDSIIYRDVNQPNISARYILSRIKKEELLTDAIENMPQFL